MTIGGSIALIVIGAILRFAVTWTPKYLDLNAIGVILMLAGVACLIVSTYFVVSRRRARASTQVYEQRRYVDPQPPCSPPLPRPAHLALACPREVIHSLPVFLP